MVSRTSASCSFQELRASGDAFSRNAQIQSRTHTSADSSCYGVFVIDIASALLTFAEVAIGLAGFSAILVALSGRPHQWTPVDAFRIRNILAFSFQSVFLSLVPFVLTFFLLPGSLVWQVSLLILSVATLGDVLLTLSGVYRLSPSERAVLNAVVVVTVIALLCVMAALELLAAFAIVRPASAVFFLGLVVLLGVSAVLVGRFLFARPAD